MGNCLACFNSGHHQNNNNSTITDGLQCKYQVAGGGGGGAHQQPRAGGGVLTSTTTTKSNQESGAVAVVANANHNNNYPMTAYQASQNRHNQDALEQSEVELLLGPPPPTSLDTTTNGDIRGTSSSSSSTNYGLKLLKKPMNILNGNNSSSCGGGTSNNSNNNSNNSSKGHQLLGQISDNKINALFETYKDEEHDDAILAPGIERLCCDLQFKPQDFPVLVLAWKLDASEMCRFTKTEFIQGLHTLNADSIASIRERLEEEVVRLGSDAELFKNLYRFTFRFGLEPELRTLPLDMAISLWRLVFTVHTPEKILNKWLDYLAENPQQIRGIPKDTWNMFLNFAETCDIYSYSDEDAWPSVFDDFVEYENERRRKEEEEGQGGEGEKS